MLQTALEIDVAAAPHTAWNVLWEVERYPDFLTDVLDVRVESAGQRDQRIATFDVKVFKARRFRIHLWGEAPHFVEWKLVDGEHLRQADGRWDVQPLGPGQLRLNYRLDLDLAIPVPAAIAKQAADFTLPSLLRQMRARIESRAWMTGPASEL